MLQIEGRNFTNQSILTTSDGVFVGNFVGLMDGLDVGYINNEDEYKKLNYVTLDVGHNHTQRT